MINILNDHNLFLSAFVCVVPTSVIEHTSTTEEAIHTLISSVSPTPTEGGVSDAGGLSVGNAVTISCVVTFALTFVLAFSLGVLVYAVVVKQCRGRSKSASGATPSGPVYEIVDNNISAQQKIELKENVAYGPVGM